MRIWICSCAWPNTARWLTFPRSYSTTVSIPRASGINTTQKWCAACETQSPKPESAAACHRWRIPLGWHSRDTAWSDSTRPVNITRNGDGGRLRVATRQRRGSTRWLPSERTLSRSRPGASHSVSCAGDEKRTTAPSTVSRQHIGLLNAGEQRSSGSSLRLTKLLFGSAQRSPQHEPAQVDDYPRTDRAAQGRPQASHECTLDLPADHLVPGHGNEKVLRLLGRCGLLACGKNRQFRLDPALEIVRALSSSLLLQLCHHGVSTLQLLVAYGMSDGTAAKARPVALTWIVPDIAPLAEAQEKICIFANPKESPRWPELAGNRGAYGHCLGMEFNAPGGQFVPNRLLAPFVDRKFRDRAPLLVDHRARSRERSHLGMRA